MGPLTLLARTAPASSPFDPALPLRLPEDVRLAPEQFERMIAMPLTASESGARNNEPLFKLTPLSKTTGTWNLFNSASGFLLPDGTVPSADASLVSLER